jgi:Phage portal protein
MADDTKRPSIFQKILAATDTFLDMQIAKGRGNVQNEIEDEADFFYRKSVAKDQSFFLGTQGYQEKPYRLTYDHLKQMSLKDSIVSAIIQTRQNQVSGFSKLVHTLHERGFRINVKDEQRILEEIKEELRQTPEFQPKPPPGAPGGMGPTGDGQPYSETDASEDPGSNQGAEDLSPGQGAAERAMDRESTDDSGEVQPDITKKKKMPEVAQDVSDLNVVKANISDEDPDNIAQDQTDGEILQDVNPIKGEGGDSQDPMNAAGDVAEQDPDEKEAEEQALNWRLERKARQVLQERYGKRRRAVEQFIINCGKTKDRPFESKRWNFDTLLRALIRDSYTYDQFGVERVPDNADRVHHIVPVDGSTIRFSSPELGKYKTYPLHSNYDLIYPEKELEALKEKDALELDPKLLEANMYKWVQVIRGRIERAFTEKELKVGMRNPTSDVFNNGYAVCELELLVNLITSHLNTEYYNMAYFSQGFSAKGILYLKAPLNRRKIETIRQQWQHMIRGSRNSFQTPIFAGMDEVKWIPLTQNHSDIEFQGWLQYLIKMICAIYQIDPQEIGIGMKEEGSNGTGLSGDNTQEKIDLSRDKGLYPLLRFLENFINVNIIDDVDSDFFIEFVGLREESTKEALDRQKAESEFKKTVNEIRAEDGLPPLPGMDDIILNAIYFQWYQAYSTKAQKQMEQQQGQAMAQAALTDAGGPGNDEPPEGAAESHVSDQLENQSDDVVNSQIEAQGTPPKPTPPMAKSVKVEFYRIG